MLQLRCVLNILVIRVDVFLCFFISTSFFVTCLTLRKHNLRAFVQKFPMNKQRFCPMEHKLGIFDNESTKEIPQFIINSPAIQQETLSWILTLLVQYLAILMLLQLKGEHGFFVHQDYIVFSLNLKLVSFIATRSIPLIFVEPLQRKTMFFLNICVLLKILEMLYMYINLISFIRCLCMLCLPYISARVQIRCSIPLHNPHRCCS